MKKKFKLGIIGAGFMATAIVKGAISSKAVNADDIIVTDLSEDALDKMSKLNVSTTKNSVFLANNCEFMLFAVKPQNLESVLNVINQCECNKFISIMAGVKKQRIKNVFPNGLVARCMPNTPCSISSGAIGLDLTDFKSNNDVLFIKNLLSSLGEVVLVDEDMLNVVTGVSGSSPAYFYLFVKGVIDAGIKRGLSFNESKLLAVNTMIGAGKMILNNPDKSIDQLISAVCSKGGTTIEAVNVYNDNNLTDITDQAIDACVKRAEELENL